MTFGSFAIRRVCLVTPRYPLGDAANGIATYASRMKSALESAGVETWMLAGRRATSADEHSTRVLYLRDIPQDRFSRLSSALIGRLIGEHPSLQAQLLRRGLQRLQESQNPPQIVQMEETWGWRGYLGARWRFPIVTRLHGPWFLTGPTEGRRRRQDEFRIRCEGRALRRAQAVTAPSHDVLNRTFEYFGLEKHSIPTAVIPNPIEPAAEQQHWRPELARRHSILFVGRFDWVKGADILLQAFERVLRELPDATLTFIGPQHGLPEAASLEDYMTRRPHLRGHVSALGRIAQADIAPLRQTHAVTVVCSRYETFGNAALEALASGSPLVASAVGGLREIVDDGHNALTFRAGDADALAQQITRVVCDVQLASEIGANGVSCIRNRFAPHAIAAQTLRFYSDVLATCQQQSRERHAGERVASISSVDRP